jgi:hypothetical protein
LDYNPSSKREPAVLKHILSVSETKTVDGVEFANFAPLQGK